MRESRLDKCEGKIERLETKGKRERERERGVCV